jgi:hypothetical protein
VASDGDEVAGISRKAGKAEKGKEVAIGDVEDPYCKLQPVLRADTLYSALVVRLRWE